MSEAKSDESKIDEKQNVFEKDIRDKTKQFFQWLNDEKHWHTKHTEQGLQLRKWKGKNTLRVQSKLDCSLQVALNLLLDTKRAKEIDDKLDFCKTFQKIDHFTSIRHLQYRRVLLVNARDFVLLTHYKLYPEKDAALILGFSVHGTGVTKTPGVIRGGVCGGYWIQSTGENECVVTMIGEVDLNMSSASTKLFQKHIYAQQISILVNLKKLGRREIAF